jgi:hypothetical protein
MLLHSLEIKNYRSLEHVKLDNLQHFNVLIGRNNAGKSSVFLALQQLGGVLQGGAFPPEVLTERNPNRSLEIHITFKTRSQERETFIDQLIAAGFNSSYREEVLQSQFFRMVQFLFRSAAGNPHPMHLRETKLLSQDGAWATIHCMVGDERIHSPLAPT